ncbi:hypothetical protein C8F01DRAFT_1150497 [Mycena amicta]|nr:hypothetical protein C8F01DRAFT_1150497 [Mycena amicta]
MSHESSNIVPQEYTTHDFSAKPGSAAHSTIVMDHSESPRRSRSMTRGAWIVLIVVGMYLFARLNWQGKHIPRHIHCDSEDANSRWMRENLGIRTVDLPAGVVLQSCLRGGEILGIPPPSAFTLEDPKMGFVLPLTANTAITVKYHQSYYRVPAMQTHSKAWWSWLMSPRVNVLSKQADVPLAANMASVAPEQMRVRRSFDITTSQTLNDTAEVLVDSTGGATVCLMEGQQGRDIRIGIFASNNRPSSAAIRLTLPDAHRSPTGHGRHNIQRPTPIRVLAVYLPEFAIGISGNVSLQTFMLATTNAPVSANGSLEASDEVNVRTTNGAIRAGNLTAPTLMLTTSNAGISGHLNASKFLSIYTTNAAINGTFSLGSAEDAQTDTMAYLTTTNGCLDVDMSLWSSPVQGSSANSADGGRFSITGRTNNRPLNISISTAPTGHKLALNAQTFNARATVYLPREFEGGFTVQTTEPRGAQVRRASDGTDDADEGEGKEEEDQRKLEMSKDPRGTYVWGNIYLQDGDKDGEGAGKSRGWVSLGTSDAKAVLVL